MTVIVSEDEALNSIPPDRHGLLAIQRISETLLSHRDEVGQELYSPLHTELPGVLVQSLDWARQRLQTLLNSVSVSFLLLSG